MKIGVQIPTTGGLPSELGVVRMGRLAEDAGADSVWVNDHVVMVEGGLDGSRSPYPFSDDGVPWWPADMPWYECLTAASFLAATTRECRVGTSVLILPQRNVLELAKATATLDALSGGRLVLGIGVGWFAEEMEALGYRFETRGRRTDEMIELLKRCWTGRPHPFDGEEVWLSEGLVFEPRPAQPGGPAILVGGMSSAALRRAAVRGDGWLAFHKDDSNLGQLVEPIRVLRELRDEAGRSDDPFRTVLRIRSSPETASRLPGLVPRVKELGFGEVIVDLPWHRLDQATKLLSDLKTSVRPVGSAESAVGDGHPE
jgi:probable F420-dependent oxidoreductase